MGEPNSTLNNSSPKDKLIEEIKDLDMWHSIQNPITGKGFDESDKQKWWKSKDYKLKIGTIRAVDLDKIITVFTETFDLSKKQYIERKTNTPPANYELTDTNINDVKKTTGINLRGGIDETLIEGSLDTAKSATQFELLYLDWVNNDSSIESKEKTIIFNTMKALFRFIFGKKSLNDKNKEQQFYGHLRFAYTQFRPEEKMPCNDGSLFVHFKNSLEYRVEGVKKEISASRQLGLPDNGIFLGKLLALERGLIKLLNYLETKSGCFEYGEGYSSEAKTDTQEDEFIMSRVLSVAREIVLNDSIDVTVDTLTEKFKEGNKENPEEILEEIRNYLQQLSGIDNDTIRELTYRIRILKNKLAKATAAGSGSAGDAGSSGSGSAGDAGSSGSGSAGDAGSGSAGSGSAGSGAAVDGKALAERIASLENDLRTAIKERNKLLQNNLKEENIYIKYALLRSRRAYDILASQILDDSENIELDRIMREANDKINNIKDNETRELIRKIFAFLTQHPKGSSDETLKELINMKEKAEQLIHSINGSTNTMSIHMISDRLEKIKGDIQKYHLELEKRIKELEGEIEALKKALTEEGGDKEGIVNQLAAAIKNLEKAKSDLDECKKAREKDELTIRILETLIDKLTVSPEKKEAIKKKLKEFQEALDDNNTTELEGEINTIEDKSQELAIAEQKIRELKAKLEEAEQKIRELEAKLKEAEKEKKDMDDTENQIKDLEMKLQAAEQSAEQSDELRLEINRLREEIKRLTSELEGKNRLIGAQSGTISRGEQAIADIELLKKQLNDAREEVDRLRKELEEKNRLIGTQAGDGEQARAAIELAKKEANDANEEAARLKAELDRLKGIIASLEQKLRDTITEKEGLESKLRESGRLLDIERRKASLIGQSPDLSKRVRELELEKQELENRLKEMQARLATSETSLASEKKELAKSLLKIEEAEKKSKDCDLRIAALGAALEASKKREVEYISMLSDNKRLKQILVDFFKDLVDYGSPSDPLLKRVEEQLLKFKEDCLDCKKRVAAALAIIKAVEGSDKYIQNPEERIERVRIALEGNGVDSGEDNKNALSTTSTELLNAENEVIDIISGTEESVKLASIIVKQTQLALTGGAALLTQGKQHSAVFKRKTTTNYSSFVDNYYKLQYMKDKNSILYKDKDGAPFQVSSGITFWGEQKDSISYIYKAEPRDAIKILIERFTNIIESAVREGEFDSEREKDTFPEVFTRKLESPLKHLIQLTVSTSLSVKPEQKIIDNILKHLMIIATEVAKSVTGVKHFEKPNILEGIPYGKDRLAIFMEESSNETPIIYNVLKEFIQTKERGTNLAEMTQGLQKLKTLDYKTIPDIVKHYIDRAKLTKTKIPANLPELINEYIKNIQGIRGQEIVSPLKDKEFGKYVKYETLQKGGSLESRASSVSDTVLAAMLLEMSTLHPKVLIDKAGKVLDDMGQCELVLELLNEIVDEQTLIQKGSGYTFSSVYIQPSQAKALVDSFNQRFTKEERDVFSRIGTRGLFSYEVPDEYENILGRHPYILVGKALEGDTPLHGAIDDEIIMTTDERKLLEENSMPLGAVLFLYIICFRDCGKEDNYILRPNRSITPKKR